MGLNKSKGNMYPFIDATWNTVKGACPHNCSYCYMKRWGKLNPPRLDESEFKTDLGSGNFIFVGSSNDLFAAEHPDEWTLATLKHCEKHDNRYLLQSKNPARILNYIDAAVISDKTVVCTTIETNRHYPDVMGGCPLVDNRADAMNAISEVVKTYVTIEPVMDFDLPELVELIRRCNPQQVNIGADSGNNHLPEPPAGKVLELIDALSEFTAVKNKSNLNRILK
jgi:DNA repair photolyase